MGIWASYSLLKHLNHMPLLVHSDGTLGMVDKDAWRRVIPWAQFIERSDAEDRFVETVGKQSSIASSWRDTNHTGLKLFDPHLFGSLNNILMIDSDVLFFEYPLELINSIDGRFHWNHDVQNAYTVPLENMRTLIGSAVPEKLNSGVMLMPRLDTSALRSMAAVLELFYEHGWRDLTHFWYEQTIYAGLIGSLGHRTGCRLSQPYDCVIRASQECQVARHYCGNGVSRPRFFTEGVPRVANSLDLVK